MDFKPKSVKSKAKITVTYDLDRLAGKWPSDVVAREKVGEFSGGILNSRYMANLDSKGEGPADSFYLGRKKAYPVESLVVWMRNRMSPALR